jgi:DNA-binding NarL/FixJ family response regulator
MSEMNRTNGAHGAGGGPAGPHGPGHGGDAPPPVRILVVDDQDAVRAGFAALLATQGDFEVVGSAADGSAAVRLCELLHPDLVLMDVRMPLLDGIEATRLITVAARRRAADGDGSGGPRIVMLTTFDLDEHVYDALAAGASGFLLKDMAAERLFDAVRVVAAGEALLAPTVTRRLIGQFVKVRPAAAGQPTPLGTLTPRETETLRLVAEGLSNAEIAGRLVVSAETVKTHVSRVLTKLGARDRAQAIVLAYEYGLVVPGRRP